MPHYRVYRLKEGPRESFRWAAHTGGLAVVKPKDYALREEIQADNPYDLWKRMTTETSPLCPGDLLEEFRPTDVENCSPTGSLCIAKYIGFEPAEWFVPESKLSEAVSQNDLSEPFNQDREARLS